MATPYYSKQEDEMGQSVFTNVPHSIFFPAPMISNSIQTITGIIGQQI